MSIKDIWRDFRQVYKENRGLDKPKKDYGGPFTKYCSCNSPSLRWTTSGVTFVRNVPICRNCGLHLDISSKMAPNESVAVYDPPLRYTPGGVSSKSDDNLVRSGDMYSPTNKLKAKDEDFPRITILPSDIHEVEKETKEHSGGDVNYYVVDIVDPKRFDPYTAECEDIIEALDMNFAEGCAFKAIWRKAAARTLGKEKKGNNALYDAEKIVYYGQRQVVQEQRKIKTQEDEEVQNLE